MNKEIDIFDGSYTADEIIDHVINAMREQGLTFCTEEFANKAFKMKSYEELCAYAKRTMDALKIK